MTATLPIAAAALVLCAAAGLATLVWLPGRVRRLLLPALPLLGAMSLVVGLHATGYLMGVRTGLWIVLAIGAVALVARSLRCAWWHDLGEWPWLLVGLAVGTIALLLALTPSRTVGANPISPTGNNDAFAYISNSAWLVDHPLTQLPSPSNDPPAYGYARLTLSAGYREGEELDQAAVATVTGQDPIHTWYATSAVWLMLLPGAMVVAAASLRLPRIIGLIAGGTGCVSSLVVTQVMHSNSAGMLGLVMAPVALALTARYFDDAVEAAREGVPGWLAAGSITAVAGAYTEYLPLVAVGLIAYMLIRRTSRVVALVAGLRLGILALLIGPLVWFRAAGSLFVTTAITGGEGFPSPFLGGSVLESISHYVGTVRLFERAGHRSSYGLVAVLGAGTLAAILVSPARRFFAMMLGSIAFVVALLSTVHRFPYGQGRAVEVTAPLVLLACVAGYFAAVERVSQTVRWRWAAYPLATGAAAAAVAFIASNYLTIRPYLGTPPNQYLAAHLYNASEFDAAHAWLASVSGPQGADGMVINTQVWEGVWLQYRFRDLPKLGFPFVTLGYNDNRPATEYFDGQARRYAVVENDVFMSAGPGVVVGHAGDFAFLDLGRGRAVLAVGTNQFNPLELEPSPAHQWMADGGDVLVVHDPTIHRIDVLLTAPPGVRPVLTTISAPGSRAPPSLVSPGGTDIMVELPPGTAVLLHLDNVPPATVTPPDPRPRSIGLIGIRIAG